MADEQKPKQEEAPKPNNPPDAPTLTAEEQQFADATGRPV